MSIEELHSIALDILEKGRPFASLNDEERKAVLEAFGSEEEYAYLVRFNGQMKQSFQHEQELEPTKAMRRAVLQERERSGGFTVWLNSAWLFLWPPQQPAYRRPLLQFAALAVLVVGVWQASLMITPATTNDMAMNEEAKSGDEESTEELQRESKAEAEGEASEVSDGDVSVEEEVTVTLETQAEKARQTELEEEQLHLMDNKAESPVVMDAFAGVADEEVPANPPGGFNQPSEYWSVADAIQVDDLEDQEGEAAKADASNSRDDRSSYKDVAQGANTRFSADQTSAERSKKNEAKAPLPSNEELIDLLYTAY